MLLYDANAGYSGLSSAPSGQRVRNAPAMSAHQLVSASSVPARRANAVKVSMIATSWPRRDVVL